MNNNLNVVKRERMSPLPEGLQRDGLTSPPFDKATSSISVYATPTNSNTHSNNFTFMQKSTPITSTTNGSSITVAAAASTPSSTERKSNASFVRSSWVWNHFVQTPENPFRVQCQFPMPSEGPDTICGVILTRDKTGSTGSMCRHLGRVHQIMPSSTSSINPNKNNNGSSNKKSSPPLKTPIISSPTTLPTTNAEFTPVTTQSSTPASGDLLPENSNNTPDNTHKRTFSAMNGTQGISTAPSPANKKPHSESTTLPPTQDSNAQPASQQPKTSTSSKSRSGNGSNSKKANKHMSKEQIISRTIPYFIQSGMCLDRAQYSQFRDFVTSLDINFPAELQSYNSLLELALRWHNEMKAGIKDELVQLSGQVSLSCGVWKPWDNCGSWDNKRRDRLFVVVAHFIDNTWALKRVLLKIEPLRWYQSNVVKLIQGVVEDFGIKDKIFTVLTDNIYGLPEPSIYSGLGQALKLSPVEPNGFKIFESLVTDIYFLVDEFLYNDSGRTTTASPLRNIVKAIEGISDDIESISIKTEYFQKCQKEEPILVSLRQPNDDDLYSKNVSNQTGWRLFFQLISNAVNRKECLQKYLKKYDDSGSNEEEEEGSDESILQLAEGKFGGKEWAGLEMIYEILRPIYTTLNDLEASAYNTAGVTSFAIESMIKAVKEVYKSPSMRVLMARYGKDDHHTSNPSEGEDNEEVRQFVEQIGTIYGSRIKNNSMFKCVQVMDPNFKRLFRHMTREEQGEIRDKFKNDADRIMSKNEEAAKDEDQVAVAAAAVEQQLLEDCGDSLTEFSDTLNYENSDSTTSHASPIQGSKSNGNGSLNGLPTTTTRSMRRTELENGSGSSGFDMDSNSAGENSRNPGFFQSLVNNEETVDSLTFEIDEYVRVSTGVRLVDPYNWWSKNSHAFPQLGALARTYMAVPGWNDVLHDGKLMEESVVLLRARNGNQHKSLGKEMCLRQWMKNGYSSYCMI